MTPAEQTTFAADLVQLDLDDVAWLILNGSTSTGTPHSIPKVLRGYRGGKLAGVAYLVECRRYGQSLFPQSRLASLIDLAPVPICIWLRAGALTDAVANPGFVAAGVDRAEFVAHAVIFLRSQYLMGGVLEASDDRTAGVYADFPFCTYGVIDLRAISSHDDLYAGSKNLKRKVSKFRNKGGDIEIVHGPLSADLCAAVMRCMDSIQAVLVSPFQDNYNNLVLHTATQPHERVVHFIARIQGECVGFHSFAWSGNALRCLSGAFDRTRHTNYHAYENLILASIHFCLEHGLQAIQYGMVVNETKAKMMSHFVTVKQRYFSRFTALNTLVSRVMAKTHLASTQLAAYAHLGVTTQRVEEELPEQ